MSSDSQDLGPLCTKATVYVAPSIDGAQAANFWKFWINKSDVYATKRTPGDHSKFSIHQSGEIHFRSGDGNRTLMKHAIELSALWTHALHLRILIAPGAARPDAETFVDKSTVFLLDLSVHHFQHLDLLIGTPDADSSAPIPSGFAGATVVWRSLLREGRNVVLLARQEGFSDWARARLKWLAGPDGVKFKLARNDLPAGYAELTSIETSLEGANAVIVSPLGDWAIQRPRLFVPSTLRFVHMGRQFKSESCRSEVAMPNGTRVAAIAFRGKTERIYLSLRHSVLIVLGDVRLDATSSQLIDGKSFENSTHAFSWQLGIEGYQSHKCNYSFRFRFDGTILTAELVSTSQVILPIHDGETMFGDINYGQLSIALPATPCVLNAKLSEASQPQPVICEISVR